MTSRTPVWTRSHRLPVASCSSTSMPQTECHDPDRDAQHQRRAHRARTASACCSAAPGDVRSARSAADQRRTGCGAVSQRPSPRADRHVRGEGRGARWPRSRPWSTPVTTTAASRRSRACRRRSRATPGMPERQAVGRRQARVREIMHTLPPAAQEAIRDDLEGTHKYAAPLEPGPTPTSPRRHRTEDEARPRRRSRSPARDSSRSPWPTRSGRRR